MKGEVLGFNVDKGVGHILSDDKRFPFVKEEWLSSESPKSGQTVDFVVDGDGASAIYVVDIVDSAIEAVKPVEPAVEASKPTSKAPKERDYTKGIGMGSSTSKVSEERDYTKGIGMGRSSPNEVSHKNNTKKSKTFWIIFIAIVLLLIHPLLLLSGAIIFALFEYLNKKND